MLDLMANHISKQSAWFQDFLRKGRASVHADLFIPVEKYWPDGEPPEEEVSRIFLRRPSPFSTYVVGGEGKEERLWTTFGKEDPSEQVDLDARSPATRQLFAEALAGFARHGVRLVRLDAVGYVVKKPGTSCFFVEPEIYEFLDWIAGQARAVGIEILPEVHASHEFQLRLAAHGYWVYDFVLPYRVLEALLLSSGRQLRAWLAARPPRQFTMLDCHDGIPVKPDLNGLYQPPDVRRVVELCLQRGGNLSRVFSPKHQDPDGFDVHQIRGTLYSLLGGEDPAFLAARAIQLFVPGVPQVYYVSLLAGENDQEAGHRPGDGREINRRNFSVPEIERELQREVVQRQLRLIRLRNEHPAFSGEFRIELGADWELGLAWRNGPAACRLQVDLRARSALIEHTDSSGRGECFRV
jgi:sucrose phosphorylase